MAGGGGVDHDQVGHAGPLERLDLPQHEQVVDAGRGGGDHVEDARCGSAGRAAGCSPWSSRYSPSAAGAVTDRARIEPVPASPRPVAMVTSWSSRGAVDPSNVPRLVPASTASTSTDRPHDGSGMSQHRRDRRLADTALAGHDQQPGRREERLRIHRLPTRPFTWRHFVRRLAIVLGGLAGRARAAVLGGRPARPPRAAADDPASAGGPRRRRPDLGLPRPRSRSTSSPGPSSGPRRAARRP